MAYNAQQSVCYKLHAVGVCHDRLDNSRPKWRTLNLQRTTGPGAAAHTGLIPVRRRLRMKRFDLRVHFGIDLVGHHPFGVQPRSTHIVTDAEQIAMSLVSFQTHPKRFQIPFFAFENGKEMRSREQEHAGDVIAFVVAARGRNDLIEPRRRERR